ncbi:MAG: hypothetical protein WCY75_05205 [Sulfurimonadaceae bacterium]
MECFVHIGTAKTGTTTIQKFLAENKNQLADVGYCVDFDNSFNNWPLALMCISDYREDIILNALYRFANIQNKNELNDFSLTCYDKLQVLIDNNKDKKFIFSSENIHLELKNQSELRTLKNTLARLGFSTIKIVIYLREPYELACSLFSEIVKHGYANLIPPEPSNELFQHVCNHKNTVKLWESVFGKENLVLRLFDNSYFYKNSLLKDFLHSVGINKSHKEFQFPTNNLENKRLNDASLIIKATLNNFKLKNKNTILQLFKNKFTETKYEMPPYLMKKYKKQFSSSMKWVIDKYFKEIKYDSYKVKTKNIDKETNKIFIHKEDLYNIISTLVDKKMESTIYYNKLSKILEQILSLEKFMDIEKNYIFYGYGYLSQIIEKLYSHRYNLYFIDKNLLKINNKKIFSVDFINSIDYDKIFITVLHDQINIQYNLTNSYSIDTKKIYFLDKVVE